MRRVFRIFLLLVLALVVILTGFRLAAGLRESESLAKALPEHGRLVETAMGRVFVDERGPEGGIPLLLIHGSVGWSGFWDETLDALAKAGYRAIAMDLSPMGYSERDAAGDYSRTTQARRITALIDAMAIKPVLVAHSFGAGPGLEAVMAQQDHFRAAVIIAGAVGLHSHKDPQTLPLPLRPQIVREFAASATITNPLALKPLLALFLARKDRALPVYTDILAEPLKREGTTRAMATWFPTLLETPRNAKSVVDANYKALTLPILYIWGELDTATPLPQGEELTRITPGATLTVLPGLGHIPQIEDPPVFQQALISALSGLVAASAAN